MTVFLKPLPMIISARLTHAPRRCSVPRSGSSRIMERRLPRSPRHSLMYCSGAVSALPADDRSCSGTGGVGGGTF